MNWAAMLRRLGLTRRASLSMLSLASVLVSLPSSARPQGSDAPRVIDDFADISDWSTHPSDGTTMRITSVPGRPGHGRAMRIDFAFSGGGYAIVRRAIPVDLPANYQLSFFIRGEAPSENLEFKLVDSTGDNVWWRNQRDFEFPRDWQQVRIKKRQIEFAWGPLGGGDLRRAAAIEISITAGSGGRGSVWLDDLVLEPRAAVAVNPVPPAPSASSSMAAPALAIDADPTTAWRSAPGDRSPWLAFDFGAPRELGGLVIDWLGAAFAPDYDVQISPDGRAWETTYAVRGGNGGRDYLYLPETETRWLRLVVRRSAGPDGVAISNVAIEPIAWAASRNAFFTAVASDAPRGSFPKYLDGKQSYWTIVGVNGDDKEALINEQGMLEVDKSAFSIEPFLYAGDRLITWADATTSPALLDGYLPIPSVTWHAGDLSITTTAIAEGPADSSVLWARYAVENRGTSAVDATLFLALRPFQVNPPAQFLNTPGGAAIVRAIAYDDSVVRVTGDRRVGTKTVVPVTAPSGFGAITFDGGGVIPYLRRGALPSEHRVADSLGAASAALAYRLSLAPRERRAIWIAVPFHETRRAPAPNLGPYAADAAGLARLADARGEWHEALDRVELRLPPSAARVVESLKANLAYMLVTRDGPALHPGARSYERAWIRDGSMMSAALLRLGHPEEVREFAEWYARFQYSDGKVPCCVDARGADPVPENDSNGQLPYLFAEYYRYTGDRAFLERMWPHVISAVSYIDSLRHSRMTAEYRSGEKRAYFGLMPQSISHEGYSAKPMHSYWDDLFTLRGLKDATEIAALLGHEKERARFATIRDEFRRDLMASYRAAMAQHRIDYLPGSVELGDFDATSTTVGVAPGGELVTLPHPALERTFEKYWENFVARRDSATWVDYTPYELRVVGTMVRLGWRDRAHALLDFFFAHQRPPQWRDWGEIVYRDSTATRFVGDMPHTWVGSDYIRSVLDMLAYERERDSAVVIGEGVTAEWVTAAPGVVVRRLPTYHGALDFSMRAIAADTVDVTIAAERVPPGGFVVRSPFDRRIRHATIDGIRTALTADGGVRVRRARARVVLTY